MIFSMKTLVFYLIPFIIVISLDIAGISLLTEVKGNSGQAIWVSCAIAVYYFFIIFWHNKLDKALIRILWITILALLFLPVRQTIAIVNYVNTDNNIYWLERPYWGEGVLQVFVATESIFIRPEKIYQDTETTHEAFLELDPEGRVILVYSRDASDQTYHRHAL